MIIIDGIQYQQTAEGYPYKMVKVHEGGQAYTVFASLAQNIHYLLAKSERVSEQLEALHSLNGVMDLGLASRVFDSDTAVRVFNPEIDTKMSLALLNANEEEAVTILHEYAVSILYKLFDKNLHLRLETQNALLSIKNKKGQALFTRDEVMSSSMFAPVLINAVYASIAFGFSYVFEQASIKKREALPGVSYIREQLLKHASQDELILEKVKMLINDELGTLRHDHLSSMTKEAKEKTLEAIEKIEAATSCQTILVISQKLCSITLSENKEVDEKIKIALSASERQCIDFMERDPLKKVAKLVVKRINPRLESPLFEDFSVELKTRLAKKEEEDIHYVRQFGLAVRSLDEETKALRREYDQYELPVELRTRASPKPLKMTCFKKMSEIQQEVLTGLANPETAEEVRAEISAKRRELNNYLIMAEIALSMEADDHVERAMTEILALNKEGEPTVETKLNAILAASDVTSYEGRELLILRAEKLRSEIVGLYNQVNERYAAIKEVESNVSDEIARQDKFLDLQASMGLTVETLSHFSVMERETGVIQEGYEGLKQVKELQALRDTAYSFHKKFFYAFEEVQALVNQKMVTPEISHDHVRFDALNSTMGHFLDSTRQAKIWTPSFNEDEQNTKVDALVNAIRQVALDRLKVKRLFRTGEGLKLYQRAAGIISPKLDSTNLNQFIKEMTSFEKWKKWGLGGVMMTFNIEGKEQKYRLPHGVSLMWEIIKDYDLVYNAREKCFELSQQVLNKKDSDSQGESEGELRQGKSH